MRFDLSDEDWALLEPLLPRSRKSARVDDRKIMNAIFYVLRTGMLGVIYRRATVPTQRLIIGFNWWSRRGTWKRVFDQLASKSRGSPYLIDSTIVKAHRAASGGKGVEKNQGIGMRAAEPQRSTAIVDSKGWPLSFLVTGGQESSRRIDTEHAPTAAGYDSEKVCSRSRTKRLAGHPEPLHRRQEGLLLQAENFFCCIKDWRRIVTRYNKFARNFLAATTLIGALYWIKL